MITIYRHNGTARLVLDGFSEGSIIHRELMSDHYVSIPFTLDEPIYFRIGDYIDVQGFGRFELSEPYIPKYNQETSGYDYVLRFDAYYMKWKNKRLRYIPSDGASETSFNLTASIGVHMNVILAQINALGLVDSSYKYNGQAYVGRLVGFPTDMINTAKLVQYNSVDILTGILNIATVFECECWVEDNVIFFGKCLLDGEDEEFELDENVLEMSGKESSSDYATRIIAFGSTRNLPDDYRHNSGEVTINGIAQKRLMLPLATCPNGYVQDSDVQNEVEAIEAVVVFDDIYPKTDCIVSGVSTYTDTYTDPDTGETITQTFYRLTDGSGLHFSSEYILEGETLHIIFQSGSMNGMDFECKYNDDEQYYEVIVNENYGRKLPDEDLHPEIGNKFILVGWDASKIASLGLVDVAEENLRQAVLDKIDEMKIDPNTYTCKMMSDWYSDKMDDESFVAYSIGQPVNLINPTYFENGRRSRIIGYELKLDILYDQPTYIVGESLAYSRSKDIQQQIESITYNGQSYQPQGEGGSGVYIITTSSQVPSSDYNVYSALRSDRQFLRRDQADTAHGVLTFKERSTHEKGANFGTNFVPGIAGIGGRIDEDANGELNSLTLRKWLEVPELRYNRVSIYTGIRWDTFGGGIIESVTPNPAGAWTGTGKLKLDAGEIGAIAVGDLCMGIWHDETGNDIENSDDNRGNFTFAGFKTVYFVITGVSGTHNENFTYTLRSQAEGGNGVHPFAQMHFAGRGSTSDTSRQAFTYTTTEYSLSLKGVSTWEFQPSNYYEIRGHIEGFSMPAIDHEGHPYTKVFHGYGQVFGNAYVFGDIDQFERAGYTMLIDQSLNGSLAPGETEQVTIKILDGYGLDCTTQFSQISVTRDTGDAASDAIWNARHTQVDNPFDISFSDLGIDGINRMLAVFHVVATDEADDMSVSGNMDFLS